MKMYQFTIQLIGTGEDAKEAWADVCEHLTFDIEEEYRMPDEKDYEIIEEWED